MATILIVDDRPTNREVLVTLLGYKGHRLLEASDGAEGLAVARAERPDLIITDILMPTMDGYEFVRQLRAEPALAQTPIIFYTAHYREQEARNLAEVCGVTHILTKPIKAAQVLQTVEAALGRPAPPDTGPLPEAFDREHLRLLTDKLSQTNEELRRANERLSALIDFNLRLALEQHPQRVLQSFCQAGRELIGARWAAVCQFQMGESGPRHLYTSGLDAETAGRLGSFLPRPEIVAVLMVERHPYRLHNPQGDPTAIGLPASCPPIHSFLATPLISPTQVYGWLCLIDKVGGEEFSQEDEDLAAILSAQTGRIYENGRLYAQVQRHAHELEQEIHERKQAEVTLRRSEERFRLLIEGIRDYALIMLDPAGKVASWNSGAERFSGYQAAEIIGQPISRFYPPADVAAGKPERLLEAAAAQGRVEDEGWQVRKDGSQFWANVIITALRNEAGQLRGFAQISRDMTERKQAEAETRRTNRELALLNQIIAASVANPEPELILETACRELALAFDVAQTRAFLLNDEKTQATVVAEYPTEGMPGRGRESRSSLLHQTFQIASNPALHYLHTHKAPLVIDNVLADARLAQFHDLIRPQDFISALILPLVVESELVGALVLEATQLRHFSSDEVNLGWRVAEQVAGGLARTRLLQTSQRLSAAIEQGGESVIITDTEGIILYVNPAFEHITGYSRAEAVGQNPRLLKSGRHDAAFYEELWRTLKAGQVWHGRFVNKRKDGALYTVETTITPVRDESGVIVNYVGIQHDITRELQLEEQYRQAQKMEAIGRLAGGVAHDFNNILVVITGYSELVLERHLDADNPLRKYIEEIKKAGERAAELTRQLLAFSRKQVLQPEVLDLNEVIAAMEMMLHRLIGEDIELVIRSKPGLGGVKADPGQIEQIIMNLAINARDAMPQGGRLTLETANVVLDESYPRQHAGVEPGRYVMLAVSDTGVGMDAATRARIFEPFFTTKEQGKGTGLGLATVYGIVKQSGGDIWVYSEPGRGTTFKIYLPQVDEASQPVEPQPLQPELLAGTETVLLVEDEAAVRTLARQVLEMRGYSVLEASHGGEALLLAEQQPVIDLLVTDVIMPGGLNGHELAERLQSRRPELKVLYMSGYTDDAIVHHGVLEAGVHFLQKPFSPGGLAQKVRQVLDSPR